MVGEMVMIKNSFLKKKKKIWSLKNEMPSHHFFEHIEFEKDDK